MASPRTQPSPTNVYLLRLTDDGAPNVPGQYIYLPPPSNPPYVVRFVIEGTSSICREGSLWVNIPEKGEDFQRDQYRQFKLKPDFNKPINFDIPIYAAGAFDWYTTYTPLPDYSTTDDVIVPPPTRTETFYLDVCPNLTVHGEQLPLNAVSLFSTISKFMGQYPTDWEKHLAGIANRGYNMVHFTPLNVRGDSNSPYSIADQHNFDPEVFPKGESDVAALVKNMEEKYGLLSLTDIVWNHTANNSKWLEEHPEAGYSVRTAPHLESALLLDNELLEFGANLESLGYATDLKSNDDLLKIIAGIKEHVIAKIKLWEFYICDVEKNSKAVVDAWKSGKVDYSERSLWPAGMGGLDYFRDLPMHEKVGFVMDSVIVGDDRMGERYRRKAQPETGAILLAALLGPYDPRTQDTASERAAYGVIHKFLEEANLQLYKEYDADCAAIIDQLYNRIKYVRLDNHGPKQGPITPNSPLIESYFTRLPRNKTTSKHDETSLDLANNGWIWAADVMKDNAGPQSKAYLRREVIVWGDCVKLRYGKHREDNPFLWDFQAKYTRLMAKYFHGFRIDNCHSTPLPLAQYMLDGARRVRPDLVCVAELFSGDEKMDFKYVEQLGLSCLIREAMQAWETRELSRLVHRHAGVPIGSFDTDAVMNVEKSAYEASASGSAALTSREVIRTIKESPVHALFMDCTHDNETPAQKRDARDTLPNAALVSMCACATGSVFGYDEVYPRLIELVHEKRQYTSPYSSDDVKALSVANGIGGLKRLLNNIHVLMGKDGYDETFIHHDHEYITIHRVHPRSRKGYFLIAHTAFPGYGNGNGGFPPVHIPGTKAKSLGSWTLEVDTSADTVSVAINDKVLRGLPSRVKALDGVTCDWADNQTTIRVGDKFPPGSIALFETSIPGAGRDESLDKFITSGGAEACKNLTLADLNFLLYRCEPEERQSSGGKDGVYVIPGSGPLVYAGLQGWWSVLRDVVEKNDLGHPICQHLREGTWALDYCFGRLERAAKKDSWFAEPAKWLEDRFAAIREVPSFMLPRYFAMVIQTLYSACVDRSIALMSPNIQQGQDFLQQLALVSVQCIGYMDNASLWPDKLVPSMSAGLPHFSSDWARCWGRDIMISLRGLMIATGRWEDAKEHIFAFASVLKHGTVPNLLGSGKSPRYNSRDSIWFFLQCIQDYCKLAPEGLAILQESVRRRFLPYDDTWFEYDDPRAYSKSSTIEEIIQEALQQHATGQKFREYNAGPNLDSQMKDNGFNLEYAVDWENGMVFGGNQDNCGTWMDKMGESEKAGSKGVPGTPRDGAAVEITGMLYSTVKWVAELHSKGLYKYGVVTMGKNKDTITFAKWANKIKANFERCYYIPTSPSQDSDYDVDPSIINRRGIYKDLYKSGKPYEDYQLRPNFPIAMVCAPDLFTPEFARGALEVADKVLRGPLGMATLDPSDLNYRPNYHNSEDSTDFATSKGRNYHQGPEWIWPRGYFLRAFLKFDLMRRKTPEERTESFQQVTRRLKGCMEAIKSSPWAGLTELTNQNGAFCDDSSPTQAWSASCLIDLFQEGQEFQEQFKLGEEESAPA